MILEGFDGAPSTGNVTEEEISSRIAVTKTTTCGMETMPPAEILIVDDEEMILEMLDQILSAAGYDVRTALGGRKALELYEQHPVNLILTDIKMPGIDGYHLLKEVKAKNPDVRVVLMSGYSNDFSIHEAIELGADEFIVKPFRRNDILQVLASAEE